MSEQASAYSCEFEKLGLSKGVAKAVELAGYSKPSPIQEKSIPAILAKHDLMALAQTGTGKTAAYGIPLI